MAYWRDLTNVWSANRILNEKGSFTLVTRNNIKVMDLVRKQCPICRRLDPMLPFMTLYLYNVPFGFATLRFTFTTPCFFRDKSDRMGVCNFELHYNLYRRLKKQVLNVSLLRLTGINFNTTELWSEACF